MPQICNVPRLEEAAFAAEVLESQQPAVVLCVEGLCRDCGTVEHPLSELRRRDPERIRCFCIDVADSPALAARLRVSQVPTLLVFRGGRVVRRLVGCPLFCELEMILRMELAASSPRPELA